ncbi:hypothetical protein [Inquilinus sp. CAU 1745]|uniref:hypothetical protein n=1 Tax=Inquilinus sp. CAU 1745 TaxID=3140369 RepID=UPI00325AB077
MLDLIQHPCVVRDRHGRRFAFTGGTASPAHGFPIKSGMTKKGRTPPISPPE